MRRTDMEGAVTTSDADVPEFLTGADSMSVEEQARRLGARPINAVMGFVEEVTGGQVRLGPGTLYRTRPSGRLTARGPFPVLSATWRRVSAAPGGKPSQGAVGVEEWPAASGLYGTNAMPGRSQLVSAPENDHLFASVASTRRDAYGVSRQ
jgi:hypothetical protein